MADGDSDEGLLRQLLAGQASTDAGLKEIFRRLDKAEKTAGEARDIAKALVATLQEQNAMAKIAEVRGEFGRTVEVMRADFVAANNRIRTDLSDVGGRVLSLEKIRDGGKVLARTGKLVFEAVKLIVAAGAGGLLLKFFGAA